MSSLKINGDERVIEPFSARKATRMFKLVDEIVRKVPEVSQKLMAFQARYREQNVRRMPRSMAMIHFAPERLEHITDEQWQQMGNVIEMPAEPGTVDVIAHILPDLLDVAESEVVRIAALILMRNDKVRELRDMDDLRRKLDEDGDVLLDLPMEDLVEVFVVGAEVAGEQWQRKAAGLGPRMGALRGLFGVATPTETTDRSTSSTPTPDSSSSSEDASTGDPTSSSTPTGDSSSVSVTA
jgi:hypothetical protein